MHSGLQQGLCENERDIVLLCKVQEWEQRWQSQPGSSVPFYVVRINTVIGDGFCTCAYICIPG